jgi:hypothetical protein
VEGAVEVHNLDEFSPGNEIPDQLVLYQNDTDDLLEKLSGAGLKYLTEMQETLQKQIKELIKAGYESVDIVSDHGFVLYGHVEEADKINPNKVAEDIDRSERFLASKVPISNQPPNTIHLKKNYKEFRHLYFAKGLKPFRSPNEYGFAHGGILPQELITPHLTITAAEAAPGEELSVGITNKEELSEQPVRQFTVRLEAGPASDVMNASRNVLVELYRDDELIDSEVVEIDQNQEVAVDFSVDEAENLQVVVLDADTRKTIDTTNVRFESPRDLGGLE